MNYSILDEVTQLGGVCQGEIISPADVLRARYASRARGPQAGDPREGGRPGEGAAGLSHPHNSPRAVFWVGGGLMKVSRGLKLEQVGGGKRGAVVTFSDASRRRLLYKVAQVETDKMPLFLTITYPDKFPDDPKKWARDIDAFRKRFTRRGWGAIWKKELKPRQSGESAGQVAPHFHMLVWGANYSDLRSFCARAWWEIVGSGNLDHLAAGVRVERVNSKNGVKRYAAKYLCKEDEGQANKGGGLGRFWGVINAAVIPWAVEVPVDFDTQRPVVELLRLMRRFMGMKKRGNLPGLTMFCDAGQWFDNLHRLVT